MLEINSIKKYEKMPTNKLALLAQKKFNAFIRERDKDDPCISCGSWNTAHASHYYSAGKHKNLRFNEDNVHASCLKCNYYMHGNLIPYRENLIKKTGLERVEKLDLLSKTTTTKNDRFLYIDIILKYTCNK